MGLVAIISREPRIEMEEWLRLVESRTDTVAPAPRAIINPFTGNPTTVVPRRGRVELQAESGLLGGIEPSDEFDADGELLLYTVERTDALRRLAEDIARALAAHITWF